MLGVGNKAMTGPSFAPEGWGPDCDVQYNNNCYSYACDIKAGWAQPGSASGRRYQTLSCADVFEAAIADGLAPADPDQETDVKNGCHLAALAMEPDSGFHWYRRDADGTWSHKPGDTLPTKLDNSGNPILDPRTADRGSHTSFGGFFWISKDRVRIRF
jgi:hypothetical protein